MENKSSLPKIMVAPNGARRGKSDHPAIPISPTELVETVVACRNAARVTEIVNAIALL